LALVSLGALTSTASAPAAARSSHRTRRRSQAPGGPEVKADRTEYSDTYALPTGELEERIYGSPVNHRNATGNWMPIENPAQAAAMSAENLVDVSLPEQVGSEPVRVGAEGDWVSSRLLGMTSESGQSQGKTTTYERSKPGTSFELTHTPTGVEERIELENADQPSSFRYELKAAQGLTPKLEADGSVGFSDRKGEPVALLPAPSVTDSALDARPDHKAASYALNKAGNGTWDLEVKVDPTWLDSPSRVWPVTVDPTVEVISPEASIATEIWLKEPSGETNPSLVTLGLLGQKEMKFGVEQSGGVTTRYRVKIPAAFSGPPKEASIQSSSLNLYDPESVAGLGEVEFLHATTNTFSGNWLTVTPPGGDFTTEGKVNTPVAEKVGPGWVSFPLPPKFSQASNVYMWVKLANESCASSCSRVLSFMTGAAENEAQRPYWKVTYYPQAPLSSKVVSPTEGTHTAKRLRLKAKWTAAGAGGVFYEYREGKTGPFLPVPAELVRNAKGNAVSFPIEIPVGARESETLYLDAADLTPALHKHGGTVQVRAVFEGPTETAGYTAPVEAIVDRHQGGPKDASTEVGPGTVDLLTGDFSTADSDISIPTYNSSLDFTRSYNSRQFPVGASAEAEKQRTAEKKSPLGPGWTPGAPIEGLGSSEWRNLKVINEKGQYEEYVGEEELETFEYSFSWVLLTTIDGEELGFEKLANGTYVAPPEVSGWALTAEEGKLVLSDPNGDRTTFTKVEGTTDEEYVPTSTSAPGGTSTKTTRVEYEFPEPGKARVHMITAPSPSGLSCASVAEEKGTPGCRAVEFTYLPATHWGAPAEDGERLASITYYAPGFGGPWQVAHYEYDSSGRLSEEWDPRVEPALREKYTYESNGAIRTITPPGEEPWTLEYGTVDEEEGVGRLVAMKRPSLVPGTPTAQTTIAYDVPVSGSGAPYDMSGANVGEWGQADLPVDATAVFSPDTVPTSSPPSSFTDAEVFYMDAEGHLVNTAQEGPAGAAGPAITTTEADEYGNVIRELSPQNRLLALGEAGTTKREERADELETKRVYGAEGTQLEEEAGPLHRLRTGAGVTTKARYYKVIQYDHEMPAGTTPDPHLPTRETTGALYGGEIHDERVAETKYNWALRKPEKEITVMGGEAANIVTTTTYENATGLELERRLPKNEAGGGAGTTKTVYYGSAACPTTGPFLGLPCKVEPAAQPEATGLPQVLVKTFNGYNSVDEPTEITESPGGAAANERKTVITYDGAGRKLTEHVTGAGTSLPKDEITYSPTTGQPIKQQFACESSCGGGAPLTYSSSFGASGSGNGQFSHPADIAIDAKGDIWVADSGNNRVEEFNSSGEFLKAIGSTGSGNSQFSTPKAIAFTASGNFWVADSGNSRLEEFNEKGEFLKAVGSVGSGNGQFERPESIAIDANGDLWVSDTYNYRVQELNEKGEFMKVVLSGSAPVGAIEPTGITVSGGKVWIADWAHDRVVELTEGGEYVTQIGSAGTGNGQFEQPDEVAVDGTGHLWVGDQSNERIQEFTASGEYLGQIGSAGTGAGRFSFSYPLGMAFDAEGGLWVTDTNNNRVQHWVPGAASTTEATTATYNAVGEMTKYEDADGNRTEMSYDIDGRPTVTTDAKGSRTVSYDPASGLPTKVVDSAAGTFTAQYNDDGDLTSYTLPDGITANTAFNEADEPVELSYSKTSACGETGCTWYTESVEPSAYGQILTDTNTMATDRYSYDRDARLDKVEETPQGGSCVTRTYHYDPDSNRESLDTAEPGLGGACATGGGAERSYKYDAADRLLGEGIVYDPWSRITNLPGTDAGGKELVTTYFANNAVATQTQNGVTNSFELDGSLRQRERTQAGGVAGEEIFHYDSPADSPAWTSRGSTWTRYILGITGELAGVQESNGSIVYDLTDLHGDVVATAPASPTATELLSTQRFDEFGDPLSGPATRFGWLGADRRRTELASGVIQMGQRSYVPELGRFLTPDPVTGGSANAYDYADQDPVNASDLEGTCAKKKKGGCKSQKKAKSSNPLYPVTDGPPAPPKKPTKPFVPPHIPGNAPLKPHHPEVPTVSPLPPSPPSSPPHHPRNPCAGPIVDSTAGGCAEGDPCADVPKFPVFCPGGDDEDWPIFPGDE
jgi:RHS repeat-associated protein